jgi:hypothetical protein
MKLGELTSFGHNMADSLASGICFMVGIFSVNVFREAASSPQGHVAVDFLSGRASGSPVSSELRQAIERYSELLPELASKHCIDASTIRSLSARFGTDPVAGPHFVVTVETTDGRKSVDQYIGIPGKRFGKPRRSRSTA